MRHGNSNRRQRNRGNSGRRGGNQQRMKVFDSNGPDVRIRGTAHQVNEKYIALAKDAASSGDRVLAESYMQYAEHYQRIINEWNADVQSKDNGSRGKSDDKPQAKKKDDQDLSLPNSILGEAAQVESKEKIAETTAS